MCGCCIPARWRSSSGFCRTKLRRKMPENTPFDLEDALSQSTIVPDATFKHRLRARLDTVRRTLPAETTIGPNGRQRAAHRQFDTSLQQEHRRTVKNSGLVPAFASIFAVCL